MSNQNSLWQKRVTVMATKKTSPCLRPFSVFEDFSKLNECAEKILLNWSCFLIERCSWLIDWLNYSIIAKNHKPLIMTWPRGQWILEIKYELKLKLKREFSWQPKAALLTLWDCREALWAFSAEVSPPAPLSLAVSILRVNLCEESLSARHSRETQRWRFSACFSPRFSPMWSAMPSLIMESTGHTKVGIFLSACLY